MTQDAVKALSDVELEQVIAWGEQEKKDRTAKRKQETIARIKELAGSAGITVTINGLRGRPKRVEKQKTCN